MTTTSPCPPGGWENYFHPPSGSPSMHGKCYQRLTDNRYGYTFQMCQEGCERIGGKMPCLRSQDESTFVHDVMEMNSGCCTPGVDTSCCTWIGFRQARDGQPYQWVDASCQSTYTQWGPDEPNNWGGFNEDCAMMGASSNFGESDWSDNICGTLTACLCEKETVLMVQAPTPPS